MKLIKYIVALLLVYLYIYSPALQAMSFGIDKLVFIWSVFYLIGSRSSKKYLKLFIKDFKLLAAIAFYSICIFIIHIGANGLLMYDLFLLVEPIPVACAIYLLVEKGFKTDIKSVILITSGIAGFITVYLLLHQDLATYIKTSVLRVPEVVTTYFAFRGFGFSDGLLNSYPTAQGLILGLMLVGFLKTRKIYYLLAIPVFVSVIVNARTGVVPVLFGTVLFFIYGSSGLKKWKALLGVGIVVLLFVFIMSNITLSSEAEESISWGKSTLDIITALFSGEEAENVEGLTGTMVFFPEDLITWLIGTGHNVFSHKYNGQTSDIGYIIRLLYGGIFYMILTVGYLFFTCKRVYQIDKAVGLLLLLSVLVFNYKTDFLTIAPCSRLFFLIYVITICASFDTKQKHPVCRNNV